jgi:hypothetical protein
MSPAELREFADSMGTELTVPTVPLVLMAIQTAVRASGFAAYRLSVVMLSTLAKVVLGRSLSIATYLTLTRSISVLAGPVGIALSTGWLIADIAGPAYRITVPACLLVACLRQHLFITSSNSRNYSMSAEEKQHDRMASRLAIIISRLFMGEKLSVQALSEEFAVSARTLRRDFASA